jgi:hypothetical protein
MIILDETKLTNGTLQMIGQDYGMKLSSPIEHPEWYEQEIDMIVDRFKFDIDDFKERLVSAIMNGIKIELKLK